MFDDEWQEYIGFMAKMKDVLSQKIYTNSLNSLNTRDFFVDHV
jgi:hypothetical protein